MSRTLLSRESLRISPIFAGHHEGYLFGIYLRFIFLFIKIPNQHQHCGLRYLHLACWISFMMTSSNGNISALLALCPGNSPVSGEFPAQRPVMRSFGVSLISALNKRFSKQSWGWWFETPSHSLWRHCNAVDTWRTSLMQSVGSNDIDQGVP